LAEYSAIGFTPYGVDSGPGTELTSQFTDIAAGFGLLKSALPVLAELQAAGKLKAAVEEDSIPGRMLYFDGYDMLVRFHPPTRGASQPGAPVIPPVPSGRVLVGQLGPDEFLLAGFDAALEFKPSMGSDYTSVQSVLVEEGLYEDGVWKPTYLRNGDTTSAGLGLPSRGALLKIKLMRY